MHLISTDGKSKYDDKERAQESCCRKHSPKDGEESISLLLNKSTDAQSKCYK